MHVNSPLAIIDLDDIALRLQHDPAKLREFEVCEDHIRSAYDRICTRFGRPFPGNVKVTDIPIPTYPVRYSGSKFVTYNRIISEFVEVADPKSPTGSRVIVVGYVYF